MAIAPILLASASPRRRQILETLKIPFVVEAVDADESARGGETPQHYLERVVAAKRALAMDVARRRGIETFLVADTTVVLDGRMLAKPKSDEDNRRMVRALAGRAHHVMTRFSVTRGNDERAATVTTEVVVRSLDDVEIERYVASGEGRDKAGGYAIQGLGAFAVVRIVGSYSNVVGLPACEVVLALRELAVLDAFPIAP